MKFLLLFIGLIYSVVVWADSSSIISLTAVIPNSKAYYRVGNFKTVIPGVLYRGGSSRGEAPLSMVAQQALCNNNFTTAVYLYERAWENPSHPIHCPNGQLNYIMRRWDHPEEVHTILQQLDEFINLGKGKMYIHCWHGLHASGYVAAVALKQFCGFSSEQAVNYWNSNVPPKLRYSKVQQMIRRFVPDPRLKLSTQKQAQICPSSLTRMAVRSTVLKSD